MVGGGGIVRFGGDCRLCWSDGERERKKGRNEERWERRGRSELFFLFDGVVYIILMSCM